MPVCVPFSLAEDGTSAKIAGALRVGRWIGRADARRKAPAARLRTNGLSPPRFRV